MVHDHGVINDRGPSQHDRRKYDTARHDMNQHQSRRKLKSIGTMTIVKEHILRLSGVR